MGCLKLLISGLLENFTRENTEIDQKTDDSFYSGNQKDLYGHMIENSGINLLVICIDKCGKCQNNRKIQPPASYISPIMTVKVPHHRDLKIEETLHQVDPSKVWLRSENDSV